MQDLKLTKQDYQWIYEVVREATMRDEGKWEFVCKFCPAIKDKLNQQSCHETHCTNIKYKLYKMMELL